MSPEFVKDGTRHAAAEMIRCGTTCFNDMYFFPGESASQMAEIGMRAVIGQILLEFPSMYASGPDDYFAKALSVHKEFVQPHFPLVSLLLRITPFFSYGCH